jgi:hypothetical protein
MLFGKESFIKNNYSFIILFIISNDELIMLHIVNLQYK